MDRVSRLAIALLIAGAPACADRSPRAPLPTNPTSGGAATPSPPLDRNWEGVTDPNGIPLNPKWSGQTANQALQIPAAKCLATPKFFTSPECTTPGKEAISTDLANGSFSICNVKHDSPLRGHVNWGLATYRGRLEWSEHTDPLLDDEYCLEMPTPDMRGLTSANNGTLHLEFDTRETVNHFAVDWWTRFKDLVDTSDFLDNDADVRKAIDGHEAIVIGLMGLDCEHECQAELHPVYAMALHADDDPASDVWAFFARNHGNEGLCSKDDHPVDMRTVKFKIPWRQNAARVEVASGTKFCQKDPGIADAVLTVTPNAGAELSLVIGDPAREPRMSGELHLRWLDAAGNPLPQTTRESSPAPRTRRSQTEPNTEHDLKPRAKEMHKAQKFEEFGLTKDNVCTTTVRVQTAAAVPAEAVLPQPRLKPPQPRPAKRAEEQRQDERFGFTKKKGS